jgi:hypothetical protein
MAQLTVIARGEADYFGLAVDDDELAVVFSEKIRTGIFLLGAGLAHEFRAADASPELAGDRRVAFHPHRPSTQSLLHGEGQRPVRHLREPGRELNLGCRAADSYDGSLRDLPPRIHLLGSVWHDRVNVALLDAGNAPSA